MANTPSFRIVHRNARGLKTKASLLKTFLQIQKIDVALVSETHLGPADQIKFPGFLAYRMDEQSPSSGRAYRGLAVLIRRQIMHQPLPAQAPCSIYTLGFEINFGGSPLHLYATYKSPDTIIDPRDLHPLLGASSQRGTASRRTPAVRDSLRTPQPRDTS